MGGIGAKVIVKKAPMESEEGGLGNVSPQSDRFIGLHRQKIVANLGSMPDRLYR